MVAQAANVINAFRPDAFFKIIVQTNEDAGKHKVLPDKDSFFIAKLIKIIVGINSAAPYPYHIKVCVLTAFDKAFDV